MTERNQRLGEAGERIASRYLEQQGYEVVDRNIRRQEGEIDLVALHGGTAKSESAQVLTAPDKAALSDLGDTLGKALDDLDNLL